VKELDLLDAMDKQLKLEEAKAAKAKKGGRGISRQTINATKKSRANKRKATIQREAVASPGDDDEDDSSPGNKKRKLDDAQIAALIKPPSKEETQNEFMARLRDRAKMRQDFVKRESVTAGQASSSSSGANQPPAAAPAAVRPPSGMGNGGLGGFVRPLQPPGPHFGAPGYR